MLPPPAISLLEPHSDARWAVVFRSHITRFAVIFPPPLLSWVSSMPPYPPSCFSGVHVINCWASSAQPCIISSTPSIFLLWPRYCLPVRRNSSSLVRNRDWFLNNYFIKNRSWQAWYQSQADCRKPLGAIANRLLASFVLFQLFAIVAIFCWSS